MKGVIKIKVVSNINELEAALAPILKEMVNKMANKVYETLNYFLHDYYDSWTPEYYRRTEAFLRSAVKVDAKPYQGGFKASVYIDYESMNNYVDVTGYQVAEWANTGYHGGLSASHKPHVWDDTMKYTIDNGKFLQLAVQYLKSKGISIRN